MSALKKIKDNFIIRIGIGAFIGFLAGILYYLLIDYKTNSCPITSNPYYTVLWGILLGIVLFFPEKKLKKK